MTHLEYYRQQPGEFLPHRGGLRGWGVGMIVLGALSGVFAVLTIAAYVFLIARISAPAGVHAGFAMLWGTVTYVVAAIVLIYLGYGSLQGRRWIRPVMISCTSLCAFLGLASVFPVLSLIISMASAPPTPAAAPAPTTSTATITNTFTVSDPLQMIGIASGACGMLVFMEALPLTMLWFYGRSSVQQTLNHLDPYRRWTDRCPTPVLAWCIACIVQGLGFLDNGMNGALPFFTTVLSGTSVMIVVGFASMLLLVGGLLTYTLSTLGHAMTLAATLLLGASFTTFGILGDKDLYYDHLYSTMPMASRNALLQMTPNIWIAPTVIYVLGSLYGFWISRYLAKR